MPICQSHQQISYSYLSLTSICKPFQALYRSAQGGGDALYLLTPTFAVPKLFWRTHAQSGFYHSWIFTWQGDLQVSAEYYCQRNVCTAQAYLALACCPHHPVGVGAGEGQMNLHMHDFDSESHTLPISCPSSYKPCHFRCNRLPFLAADCKCPSVHIASTGRHVGASKYLRNRVGNGP